MSKRLPGRRTVGQLVVFGLVGLVNTGIDIVIFWLLTVQAGVAPVRANVASFSVGALCSFLLNGRVTFRASTSGRSGRGKAWRFAVTTLVTLFASTLSLAGFLAFVGAMAAKLLSVGVSFVVGFLLQRFWVFAVPGTTGREP